MMNKTTPNIRSLKNHCLQILLIESNEDDQVLFTEELHATFMAGIKLLIAKTLQEAICLSQANQVDIVFSDLDLPDYCGEAALKAIADSLLPLPVVILSSTHDETMAQLAKTMGIQDYLVKGKDLNESRLIKAFLPLSLPPPTQEQYMEKLKTHLATSVIMIEQINERISHQLSVISHDMRGPICTMEGLLNLMEIQGVDDKSQDILMMTKLTLAKLKHLVDDTVNMMKIGEFETENAVFTINWEHLVSETFDEVIPSEYKSSTFLTLLGNLKQFIYKRALMQEMLATLIEDAHRRRVDGEPLNILINGMQDQEKITIAFWDDNRKKDQYEIILRKNPRMFRLKNMLQQQQSSFMIENHSNRSNQIKIIIHN